MGDQAPAIDQAKALLQGGATKQAFNTLAKQINVLNTDVKMLQAIIDGVDRTQKREAVLPTPRSGRGLVFVMGLVLGVTLIGIVGAIVYVALGLSPVSDDDQLLLDIKQDFENGTPYLALADSLPIPSLTWVPTDTPLPTVTPTPIMARDCGAWDWWNFAAGPAMDYMDTLKAFFNVDFSNYDDGTRLVYEINSEAMKEYRNRIEAPDYPSCVNEAREHLLGAMTAYSIYFSGMSIQAMGGESVISPEEWLADAVSEMLLAANQISQLTGENTDFLIFERPEN